MRKIKLKQALMLTATGLLIVMFITVFVRMVTFSLLVQKEHIENIFTKRILAGTIYGLPEEYRPTKDKNIDWQNRYPFDDDSNSATCVHGGGAEVHLKSSWWLRINELPVIKISEKYTKLVRDTISIWSGKNLFGYTDLVEIGRSYEVHTNWLLVNPSRRVLRLDDGSWTTLVERRNTNEAAASLLDLYQWVKDNDGDFIFVAAPFKVDKYRDSKVNGKLDFSNQNMDDFLADIRKYGIDTLDLRENLYTWSKEEKLNYHDYFYKTDHHWKAETAIKAAKIIGDKLKKYNIKVDDCHYEVECFNIDVLPKFFLGSLGKKVSLAKTQPDDFAVLHPKFLTLMHYVLPQKEIDVIGPLDQVAYDYNRIKRRDFYNEWPYDFYGYGDMQIINIENLLLPETPQKILLVKDSFGDPLGPMLATGVRNITMLDLRVFKGSLHAYIKEHRPDVVIVMYNPSAIPAKIKWNHTDLFDFR